MTKQPHDKKHCGAKTRAGTPCRRPAGWGTNHVGEGRCKLHGGKSTGAPKGNQNSKKHGLFSRYIPADTLEVMNMLDDKSPADLLWDQIRIQYAAIIRAQSIMYVKDKDDTTKVLKKKKDSDMTEEREWEYQFAWDKQANFLNAQSRAIAELRSSIKQFLELAHEDDERRMKLELMQAQIDKNKAEVARIKEEQNGNAPPVINIIPLKRKSDQNEAD